MTDKMYILCNWRPWPLGKLARLIGLKWSHTLLLREKADGRRVVYEATPAQGVHEDMLNPSHYGCEYVALETREPLEPWQVNRIIGAAKGMCGKSYGFGILASLALRVLTELLRGRPKQALAKPAEVCSSFVQEAFFIGGVHLVPGRVALPDDIADSPVLKQAEQPL